jgi:hypothetical protein
MWVCGDEGDWGQEVLVTRQGVLGMVGSKVGASGTGFEEGRRAGFQGTKVGYCHAYVL